MLSRSLNILKSHSFFLFGARGVGKTHLVHDQLAADKTLFIDLLDPRQSDALLLDPGSLISRVGSLPSGIEWVCIDEIQKLPKLLDVVHKLIEETPIKFALTGSSARKLKRGGANLLAGRAFSYALFPLTAEELGEKFKLERALTWGTLPDAYLSEEIEARKLYLDTYVTTYVREEILMEQVLRSLDPFRRFLSVAAQMNGEPINYRAIARDVGASDQTVRSYFQILEDTLLGYFLEPYAPSVRKRQRSAPKFYFFDVGVARALRRETGLTVHLHNYGSGKLFEHFVILEMLRRSSYARNNFAFSFIRSDEGNEVDLVIERPGMPLALIEIKSATQIDASHTRTLARYQTDLENSEAYLLSMDPHPKRISKVHCLPWNEGIKEIF